MTGHKVWEHKGCFEDKETKNSPLDPRPKLFMGPRGRAEQKPPVNTISDPVPTNLGTREKRQLCVSSANWFASFQTIQKPESGLQLIRYWLFLVRLIGILDVGKSDR